MISTFAGMSRTDVAVCGSTTLIPGWQRPPDCAILGCAILGIRRHDQREATWITPLPPHPLPTIA